MDYLQNGLSVNYSEYKSIDSDLNRLDVYFKNVKWKDLSHKEIVEEIVKIISKLWKIHCFREGNTRTTTTFLYLFMKQLRLKVNIDFIGRHAKYFRNALVLASIDQYSEYEHLTNILLDSISMKEIESGKYKTIRDLGEDLYINIKINPDYNDEDPNLSNAINSEDVNSIAIKAKEIIEISRPIIDGQEKQLEIENEHSIDTLSNANLYRYLTFGQIAVTIFIGLIQVHNFRRFLKSQNVI